MSLIGYLSGPDEPILPVQKKRINQGLQILLMSGVSVTSASQILESFWNIWSQVSQRKKPNRLSSTWSWHVYVVVNFLSQVIFLFLLFLGMLMYANEV